MSLNPAPGDWIRDANKTPLGDVLQHLGVGAVRRRTVAPCPSCGAERRGSSDPRGPVDLHERSGGTLWHCKACNAGGDGLDAVAFQRFQRKFSVLDQDDKRLIRAWFSDRRWCDPPSDHRPPPRPPAPPPVTRIEEAATKVAATYPPPDEVSALWAACRRIGDHGGDSTDIGPAFYLGDRGFPITALWPLDVVRIVPREHDWPAWWPVNTWQALRAFRLLFLAYTPDGAVASVHARRIVRYDPASGLGLCDACAEPLPFAGEGPTRKLVERCPCGWAPKPKTLWPQNFNAGGLLFADAGGVALMRGDPAAPRQVLVVEGVTDTLRAAIVAPTVPCAVIGFTSGGASALGSIRWPADAVVGVATDDDKAGEAYADEAQRAVAPMRTRRIRWSQFLEAR